VDSLAAGSIDRKAAEAVDLGAVFEFRRRMKISSRRIWVGCVAMAPFMFCGCASDSRDLAASKEGRPQRQYTIEDFMDTTRIRGASFSSDESAILVSSDETGIVNVYSIGVTSGERRAVTRSTNDSTYGISYFPKDNRVLFTRDKGGDEHNHIFVREVDGTEKDVTPGEKLKAEFAGWARDDRAFYIQTNERDKRFFDLYRVDAKTYEPTKIYEDTTGYQLGDISDDGKWLAFGKPNTTADSDAYVYNIATKEMKHISAHEGTARYDVAAFDRTSKWLYFLTDDREEFSRVKRYELATGKSEEVERAKWDIMFTYFSYNGKYRVSGINEDGRTVIKVYEHATGRPVRLPKMPEGEIGSVTISRSEKLMAFYLNSDRQPGNLHVYDFGSGVVKRLTDTLSKKIDPTDLVDSKVVRFKSFDGLQIPNILYKPHRATTRSKAPALVWVHGGPGGQTRKGYSAQIQYLVNHGYVVLGINNRGSSGYGKTFFTADDQKHGREPLWDCVAAKKYLESLPYVDREQIGIIGGSYGGYMVLAALAFQPDVFDCGVDVFGVSNWLRTLENTPPWWEAFKKALYQELGNPAKDREMLQAISPVFHADKIRKPLLVLQGANDPRVVKAESDDIVAAVRKNNVPVEYVIFDDEGHGFTKKKNQITGYKATLVFLDRHLKGKAGNEK
jgi:dipeptidyl aminopeptidase/acylaminoacyl peptidase